jgi:hypothetical protein
MLSIWSSSPGRPAVHATWRSISAVSPDRNAKEYRPEQAIEVFLLCFLERLAGVLEPIDVDVDACQVRIAGDRGFQPLLRFGFRDRFLVLAQRAVEKTETPARYFVPRVAFRPEFIRLRGLLNFAGDVLKVQGGDAVPLAFTDPVPQVVGLLGIVGGETRLSKIPVLNG